MSHLFSGIVMAMTNKTKLTAVLFNRRMLICIFTGFTSGLPLYILISLLPAWLRSEGVNLKAIGLFALIQLPFTWKFLWAPFFDRYIPPLGRRRGRDRVRGRWQRRRGLVPPLQGARARLRV